MNKMLLVNMLKHAYNNQLSKNILNLAIEIENDTTLPEEVSVVDFSNEFYSVKDIRWIKQVFVFYLF